jgi:uncharacterized protein with gpF-like domain
MQRISDLEAQVASLIAANEALLAYKNSHVEIEKLIADSFERYGRLFREDITVRVASHITPPIENTIRRCKETEEKQTGLEEKFKEHAEAVGKSADALANSFKKLQKDAEKAWNAHRTQMLEDFGRVQAFINWYQEELAKNGQKNAEAVVDCKLAARSCYELTQKVSAPVEKTIKHLEEIRSEGETAIKRAAQRLTKTYENLERPVLGILSGVFVAALVAMIVLGWIVLKKNEGQLESNLQQLADYSEQQKTEMTALFNKAMEEAKESQIDREIKVKMWDTLMKSLTPQQREAVISQSRDQVNEAERQRIGDQMHSSYEQMEGRKK